MAKRDSNGRFVTGESGNPRGREKKGETMTDVLREYAERLEKYKGRKMKRKRLLALSMFTRAINGDTVAAKYIYDRIDGKPLQKHEFGGESIIPDRIKIELVRSKSVKRKRSSSKNK